MPIGSYEQRIAHLEHQVETLLKAVPETGNLIDDLMKATQSFIKRLGDPLPREVELAYERIQKLEENVKNIMGDIWDEKGEVNIVRQTGFESLITHKHIVP